MARVMLVGQSPADGQKLKKIFQSVNIPCDSAENLEQVLERIAKEPPTVVIAERGDSLEFLEALRATLQTSAPATPLLATIPKIDANLAVSAMATGAYDCIARPYNDFDVLVTARRASAQSGRHLFAAKLRRKKRHPLRWVAAAVFVIWAFLGILKLRQGPPAPLIPLASANLGGIQWEGRTLWVADWFDSTITSFDIKPALIPSHRSLVTKSIFHMQDVQPMLIADAPEFLVSIGNDLKMRIHQRTVGLPAYQTAQVPGLNPTGLIFDGQNIWSSDGQTELLYKHGEDMRVIETVKSILPRPSGLAWDGEALWVYSNSPAKIARLQSYNGGYVWTGPFPVRNLLPEGVNPTGIAVGFGRIWAVAGGDPKMYSVRLPIASRNPFVTSSRVKAKIQQVKKHAGR